MIVTCLFGGLGNQLFQYAAARRVALRLGWPLKLDVSRFAAYQKRAYALGHFAIVEEFARPEDLARLRRTRIGVAFQRLLPPGRRTHLRERHFHFDPCLSDVRRSVYVEGYWQSERYFADVSDTIRAEFTVKSAPGGDNARLLQLIDAGESVAVHVRRGDYVAETTARRVHGPCSLEYYARALEEVRRRVRDPRYFVFSDDAAWTRENLVVDGPVTFVGHNRPDQHYEDLRLMSRCRHHVIANSTFSWWGAWLGAHPEQVVVAPRRWFASGSRQTQDLFPARWLQI